jgi:hypothetical protein
MDNRLDTRAKRLTFLLKGLIEGDAVAIPLRIGQHTIAVEDKGPTRVRPHAHGDRGAALSSCALESHCRTHVADERPCR